MPDAARSRLRRARNALVATALPLAMVLSGCAGTTGPTAGSSAGEGAWHGVEPEPVPDRPSFVLRDTSGNKYDFKAETADQPTLLYFGYTNCPDECPTAMADIAAALRTTPQGLRDRVKVVLVTTDPARDTPPVLRDWLGRFSADFVGLVGTKDEVKRAQEAVGVPPAEKEGNIPTLPGRPNEHAHKPGTAPHTHSGPLGYGVSHANVIFAYSADNKLPVVYPGGVTPADIAADLPRLAA